MTTDEAHEILHALGTGNETTHLGRLLFSERHALKILLAEREAVRALVGEFRERERTLMYSVITCNAKTALASFSGLSNETAQREAQSYRTEAATWAAAAEKLEQVLRGVEDGR